MLARMVIQLCGAAQCLREWISGNKRPRKCLRVSFCLRKWISGNKRLCKCLRTWIFSCMGQCNACANGYMVTRDCAIACAHGYSVVWDTAMLARMDIQLQIVRANEFAL